MAAAECICFVVNLAGVGGDLMGPRMAGIDPMSRASR